MLRCSGPRTLVAGGLRGHVGRSVCRSLSRRDRQVEPITSAPLTFVGHTWCAALMRPCLPTTALTVSQEGNQ